MKREDLKQRMITIIKSSPIEKDRTHGHIVERGLLVHQEQMWKDVPSHSQFQPDLEAVIEGSSEVHS